MERGGVTENQKTERLLSGCIGKTAFLSAQSAFLAVKAFTRRRKFRRIPGERVEAYHCHACGNWHLGRSVK